MRPLTLGEIKASVEKLDLPDQVRLLEYLTPKIAGAVLATRSNSEADIQEAWRRYRSAGERLGAASANGAPSLTDTVSQMRR